MYSSVCSFMLQGPRQMRHMLQMGTMCQAMAARRVLQGPEASSRQRAEPRHWQQVPSFWLSLARVLASINKGPAMRSQVWTRIRVVPVEI